MHLGARGRLPDVKSQPKRGDSEPKTLARPKDMPEAAAAIWDLLARQLAIANRLQPEDALALEKLCRASALYRTIQEELETSPLIIDLHNKTKTINLHFKALEIVEAQIERGIRHFGLSPAARGALKAANPDAEIEEFDDFLANRPTSESAS